MIEVRRQKQKPYRTKLVSVRLSFANVPLALAEDAVFVRACMEQAPPEARTTAIFTVTDYARGNLCRVDVIYQKKISAERTYRSSEKHLTALMRRQVRKGEFVVQSGSKVLDREWNMREHDAIADRFWEEYHSSRGS